MEHDPSRILIVTDIQNSFMPGGSLAVPRGDEVVPIINCPKWYSTLRTPPD